MQKVNIVDLEKFVNQEVTINGWVSNFRSSGKIAFWEIRDGSGYIQAILSSNDLSEDKWAEAQKVTQETSVRLTAKVAKHPNPPAGGDEYELHVTDFEYYQIAEEYPISKKEHGVDFLMDNRHLWLRSAKQIAIQKIRNTLIQANYDYMAKKDFVKIDAPILTPNACEGTTELFEIDYFDDKAYLSQSGQLYIESAIFAHNKVFDFGPVFRAEKSKTRRHLTEFWMMDAEMAFSDLDNNMQVQEELIRHMISAVLEKNKAELEILERDIKPLENISKPFHKITHKEAIKMLQKLGSDIKDGEDLGADDETILTKEFDNPLFVTHYPAKIKAFYMKRNAADENLAECVDLLAPEGYGEIIGGSQREDDYDTLLQRLKEEKLSQEDFQWYLDLRKYGSVPHGGFGFGLERIVAWVCGINHVRETIPFPRTINRLKP
jgi:asparaginyl-tRNA synthetase